MKHAALALLVLLVPLQAAALDTTELLGLVAMPLAVAAVSDVTGVPVGDLSHLVATLNRAQVPPTQVVQVVRYAPAALVVEDVQPTFVEYVDQQVYDGVVGPRLVTVIEERYRTYDLAPQFVTLEEPATTYVIRDDYVPPVVVTRVAEYRPAYYIGDTNDMLSLIAMPLAVAAVSEIAGVPFNDLSGLVASLNAARMPPLQVVEVLRYAPVALVADYGQPQFVPFVRTQVVSGLRGPALLDVIDQRLRTYDVTPVFEVVEPRQIIVDDFDDFFPAVVTTRVAEVRSHPHGGPPGQLKKDLGLQTGAEVVHGTRPGRGPADRVVRTTRVERDRPARVKTDRERSSERRVSSRSSSSRERKRIDRQRAERRPRVERAVERSQPRSDRVQRSRGGERTSVRPERQRDSAAGSGAKQKGGGKSQGKGKGKGKG